MKIRILFIFLLASFISYSQDTKQIDFVITVDGEVISAAQSLIIRYEVGGECYSISRSYLPGTRIVSYRVLMY